MNKTSIASLVLLNIVLLGALVFVTFGGDGQAHAVNASSARGQYVAVSGTIAGSMEMKQRQNRRPQKRVLCFEIAWTDPEDFGKKNWVDRDDVRTVA